MKVSLMDASSNQIVSWLRQVDVLVADAVALLPQERHMQQIFGQQEEQHGR
jgi:hypothetical protein